MPKKRIASFDVDQTLLDHATYRIPDSALKALDELRDDCYIVLSTGRDMDNYYSKQYRDAVQPDAVIHLNGTKITVGDELIYEHEMDKTLLKNIFEYADQAGYGLGVTIGDEDYYLHPEAVKEMDLARWGRCERRFKDPWVLLEKGVRTLAYVGREEGAMDMEKHFPELKFLMFAGRMGADVVEREASKAQGLLRLCQYYGLSAQDAVAFGDSMNDFEILQTAGLGIAMGNAMDELKQVADYVTAPVGEDGIWKACEHFHFFR
ncbi:MAG TPA: Cof-type HAD-IIB family hydrolase [Candidatus Lachnoclostridium pullistercoris]|uniref:Cof-type HAD-IIB family hydrolase n=1 Tax=Candidatus Lachnoclostridium pullistercoris TaxID=2838632 RepID=A0A9D2PDK3_9FIRM|nr:Cof-type HAD-IIB family hydrolase [Candidatus Lachnoclostridium pullistercoris]